MIGILIAAWLDVRSKPLRTFASIAGMVAAIVAVVLVDAAGVLSRNANDEYLARNYGLPITAAISAENGTPTQDQNDQLVAALAGNGFITLSPNINVGIQIGSGGTLVQQSAMWVSSAYNKIRIVDVVYGAWPKDTARSDVAHAVITEQKAQQLGFTGATAIGQVINYAIVWGDTEPNRQTTQLAPMIIDAVAATTTNAFSATDTMIVSDLPQPLFTPDQRSMQWLVRANPADFGMLNDSVASVVDENGLQVFSVRRVDQSEELAPVLDQQRVTSDAVTIVALTVGGLGILSVGLASVRERGKDYGLRRALGASKGRIFVSVIVQAIFEVILAAIIAIPLAAIALELFARQLVLETLPLPASTALPVGSAIQGLAGALVVGLVAGLIPAINAARSSVVQAIRG